ncbi:MAG: Bax inhibitor-1/YccA family protein [Crocinitomicaceae bacterium]|nr:Bax inhibitor-1/YccA family protein [Crocinitomicaceae bacterium]
MNDFLKQEGSFAKDISSDFFKSVYSYMFGALSLSGIVAYTCGTPEFIGEYFFNSGGISPVFYIVAFAPIGLALLIQWGYERLSMNTLLLLFIAYSALMGLSISSIFLVYSISSIASTFFVSAGAFAAMAILGYTTKTDLTQFGSLLYMVFIGIFIASIVNLFIGWETMDFIISILGVFVFTGLTAYHMQQLKAVSHDTSMSPEQRSKLSLIGGLQLYILFVNLFLSLLRLLGGRD